MGLSAYEQKIVDNVAEHGWFCVTVFDNESDDIFAYSVGFEETLTAPECVIFGLPQDLMHAMLWALFRKLRDSAEPLRDGQRIAGILEGYDCIAREVHEDRIDREHFNSAIWYWGDPAVRGSSLRAFQLFWPDARNGLFPWEAGCDPEARDHQPLLYLPL